MQEIKQNILQFLVPFDARGSRMKTGDFNWKPLSHRIIFTMNVVLVNYRIHCSYKADNLIQ